VDSGGGNEGGEIESGALKRAKGAGASKWREGLISRRKKGGGIGEPESVFGMREVSKVREARAVHVC